jgi:hypothetical protein
MRFLLPLLALAACTGPAKEPVSVSSDAPGPAREGTASSAQPPALPPVCALSSPPPASFEEVRGWGLLSLQMSPAEAAEVFTKAGVALEEEETHGYFPQPEGAVDGPVSHTVEVAWRFSCGGWAGILKINPGMTALAEIRLEGPPSGTESDALDLVRRAETVYGAPTRTETMSLPGGNRIDRIWRNELVELSLTVVRSEAPGKGVEWRAYQIFDRIEAGGE